VQLYHSVTRPLSSSSPLPLLLLSSSSSSSSSSPLPLHLLVQSLPFASISPLLVLSAVPPPSCHQPPLVPKNLPQLPPLLLDSKSAARHLNRRQLCSALHLYLSSSSHILIPSISSASSSLSSSGYPPQSSAVAALASTGQLSTRSSMLRSSLVPLSPRLASACSVDSSTADSPIADSTALDL
jgi:hypothetical protein